ncbi:site-specific DNA-methyltransferase [Siminovitchia fordii]|uniref:Type III restriction endonuclease EcoP15I subunit M n=1 Tax=Siminovitchia fordii TaxID=254759 RepID=A0ABQ4K0Z7_9BACI|nr:site-specific DNA-methyltransferase [Siminovitchia fordii]GIN19407.1 type III restriction endonuclease EcoP15I subunit M [Siminovitchia fordii]
MIKETLDSNGKGKLNDKKIAILKEHFPNCFSGGTLDIEKFKKEINQDIDFSSEGYEMNFLGKNYAKYIADSIDTESVLVPDVEHNSKSENSKSENIYITGDNLDVLKHLRKSYSGKVKMIYIDPPYNTGGGDFAYNDNFRFTKKELQEVLDIEEQEAERILNMTSSNSSSHSAWLTFMYPRLYLSRELLKDEGVIFISIDDHEKSQLQLLCDDVFGEGNRLGTIIWKKKTNGNNMGYIPPVHDYILAYGKSVTEESILGFPLTKDEIEAKYKNPDQDPRGPWDTMDLSANHEGPYFPIKNPKTSKVYYPPKGRYWVFNETEVKKRIEDGRIIFGKSGNVGPVQKVFLKDRTNLRKKAESWWDKHGMNEDGTEELEELIGTKIFDHPKPTELIKNLCSISTKEDDLILDFFSGSATTADAIMQLNANEEGNYHCKYILVQLDEKVKKGSNAEKAGYKTIDEIGRERIIRAAEKIKESTGADIDYGFKHFFAKELNESAIDQIKEFDPNLLASELEVEFDRDTILTTWMNQDGHGLTPSVEAVNLDGYTGYYVQDYLYLLDKGLSQQHIDNLLSKIVEDKNFNPTSVVVYGYNFTDFNILTQLETNLKQLRNEEKSIEVSLIKRY